MAIVINGSGTVTGLAVGGLPDGTVDDGTLATDSVTAAKLKDDAIASGDLPAGSVLQVTYNSQSFSCAETGTSFTNVSDGSTTFSGAITPSSTSSKILVIWTMRYSISEQNRGFKMRLNRDISGGAVTDRFTQTDQKYYYHNSTGSGAVITGVAHHEYLDSPNTTSAVTYYPQVGMDGGASVNFGSGGNGFQITLMEIGA
jgi:hypothetical protein